MINDVCCSYVHSILSGAIKQGASNALVLVQIYIAMPDRLNIILKCLDLIPSFIVGLISLRAVDNGKGVINIGRVYNISMLVGSDAEAKS